MMNNVDEQFVPSNDHKTFHNYINGSNSSQIKIPNILITISLDLHKI